MTSAASHDERLVVAHHHPGRLRVRARAFEADESLRRTIEGWLGEQAGVREVRAHPSTGSVLVVYEPARVDAGQLLMGIAGRARLAIAEPTPQGAPPQRIFDAAHALDEQVREWSDGRFGLGFVVPVALSFGSLASFVWSAHRRAPRWDNLLYWGVQFFRAFNDDRHAERRRDADVG